MKRNTSGLRYQDISLRAKRYMATRMGMYDFAVDQEILHHLFRFGLRIVRADRKARTP